MNRVKQVRQARGLKNTAVVEFVRERDMRFDAPALSKIENGVFLPTVPVAEELCKVLDCGIFDLYDMSDIDIAGIAGSAESCKKEAVKQSAKAPKTTYHLCAELPKEVGDKITDEVLQKCGFTTRREWLAICAEKLLKRYAKIKEKEAARQLDANGTAKG